MLANIESGTLVDLAAPALIQARVAAGGLLVLSGILSAGRRARAGGEVIRRAFALPTARSGGIREMGEWVAIPRSSSAGLTASGSRR